MATKVLVHVDYGSADNAGLYIKETVEKIGFKDNCDSLVFVNYFYKYELNGAVRTFERYSKKIRNNTLKKVYKFVDLYLSFFLILKKLYKYRKTGSVCVVSLNSPFVHYKHFAAILKKLSFKVVFILHDVVDLHVNAPSYILCNRMDILQYADACIVHTDESANYARKLNKEVIEYPFPLMDIGADSISNNPKKMERSPSFLFIGSIRPGKGVELLINAFNLVLRKYNCNLTIAGRLADNYDPTLGCGNGINVITGYISDREYTNLIQNADYVILPYEEGTNSGILSTVASCYRPVICSNLPMFKDSPFVKPENIFDLTEEDNGLYNLIVEILVNFDKRLNKDTVHLKKSVVEYKASFSSAVKNAYKKLC